MSWHHSENQSNQVGEAPRVKLKRDIFVTAQVVASHARVVGDELGDHFNQRRALLGEVRVGPRLVRVRVGVR